MMTYVSLINWTEQGIKNFRDTAQRAEEFTKLVESSGGTVRELLWTVGEYDIPAGFQRQRDGGHRQPRWLTCHTTCGREPSCPAAAPIRVINFTATPAEMQAPFESEGRLCQNRAR
jgi:hypothetical protein